MPGDLDAAIRARLDDLRMGPNDRTVEAIRAVLDLCLDAEDMPDHERRQWCAPTPLAIRRRIAANLGVDGV